MTRAPTFTTKYPAIGTRLMDAWQRAWDELDHTKEATSADLVEIMIDGVDIQPHTARTLLSHATRVGLLTVDYLITSHGRRAVYHRTDRHDPEFVYTGDSNHRRSQANKIKSLARRIMEIYRCGGPTTDAEIMMITECRDTLTQALSERVGVTQLQS